MNFVNPCCGYMCDVHDLTEPKSESVPRKGDLTICHNCGSVLVYLGPATMRIAHVGDLMGLSPKLMCILAVSVAHIRKRGWLKSERQRMKNN